jgi:hypothetical protein
MNKLTWKLGKLLTPEEEAYANKIFDALEELSALNDRCLYWALSDNG